MRLLGRLLLALSVLLILAAIWAPGQWWQFALTAGVAFICAGAILGSKR
jgi:hypothetical protein